MAITASWNKCLFYDDIARALWNLWTTGAWPSRPTVIPAHFAWIPGTSPNVVGNGRSRLLFESVVLTSPSTKLAVLRKILHRSVNAAEINNITSTSSAGNLNFTNRFFTDAAFNVTFHQREHFFHCRRLICECLSVFWLSRDLFSWLFSDVGGDAAIFGF